MVWYGMVWLVVTHVSDGVVLTRSFSCGTVPLMPSSGAWPDLGNPRCPVPYHEHPPVIKR